MINTFEISFKKKKKSEIRWEESSSGSKIFNLSLSSSKIFSSSSSFLGARKIDWKGPSTLRLRILALYIFFHKNSFIFDDFERFFFSHFRQIFIQFRQIFPIFDNL